MTPVEKYLIENKETDLLTDQEYVEIGKYIVNTTFYIHDLHYIDDNHMVVGVREVFDIVNSLIKNR